MKKYDIIYADPPWHNNKPNGRNPETHYPTMPLKEIEALPVGNLADKDCTLFLWATLPKLRDSFELLDAWGFRFKTAAFVWIKLNRNNDAIFWGTARNPRKPAFG